jgi:hypothetical protein
MLPVCSGRGWVLEVGRDAMEKAANACLSDAVQDEPVNGSPHRAQGRFVAPHQRQHDLVRAHRHELKIGVESREEALGTSGPPAQRHDRALAPRICRTQLDLDALADRRRAARRADRKEEAFSVRICGSGAVAEPAWRWLQQAIAHGLIRRDDLDEVLDEHRISIADRRRRRYSPTAPSYGSFGTCAVPLGRTPPPARSPGRGISIARRYSLAADVASTMPDVAVARMRAIAAATRAAACGWIGGQVTRVESHVGLGPYGAGSRGMDNPRCGGCS